MVTYLTLMQALTDARGGSRELDADIVELAGYPVKRQAVRYGGRRHSRAWAYLDGRRWQALPNVTTNLDDALRWANERLDRRGPISLNICLAGSAQVQICEMDPCAPGVSAVASSPPIAVCLALIMTEFRRTA